MTTPRKAPAKRATPHKPAGVREPQDHLKPAAQREAEGDETITVEFRGLEFTVPADPDDWPIRVHQALGRNMHIDAIELLLGPVQWTKLTAKYPKKRDFVEFAEILGEVLGFGSAGN
ncbi:hypothetical protein [Nocardia brasiliensis]|uniref:hypothetical protein n=1 Tax=Nocardia brasiliensis TaxID=37326 RepID=UPI00366E51A7